MRTDGTLVEYWFFLRLTKNTRVSQNLISNVYKKCKFHVERAEQTDYQEGQQHGTASPDYGALSTQHWNQCEHWALARAHCGGNLVCTEHPQEHPGTPEIVSCTHCVHIYAHSQMILDSGLEQNCQRGKQSVSCRQEGILVQLDQPLLEIGWWTRHLHILGWNACRFVFCVSGCSEKVRASMFYTILTVTAHQKCPLYLEKTPSRALAYCS